MNYTRTYIGRITDIIRGRAKPCPFLFFSFLKSPNFPLLLLLLLLLIVWECGKVSRGSMRGTFPHIHTLGEINPPLPSCQAFQNLHLHQSR